MNKNISFKMWGERGLVGTFFADIYQLSDLRAVNNILQTAQFPEAQMKNNQPPEEFHAIIEPDFSEFGRPDAILNVKYEDQRAVIIVEAKRTDFKSSCNKRRGDDGYNSTMKGQLELDYRLAMALSKFRKGDSELAEPEWVLATDYKGNLKGKPRRLQKSNVLRDVASLFSGEEFGHYYYLVITTDEANPLDKPGETFLPELFKPESSGITLTFSNCWREFRKQFGWLNYKTMKEFIDGVQDRLPLDSLFLTTYDLNKGNLNVPDGPDGPPEGVNYYKEFIPLWEDGYDFTIVPGSKGYSAKHKGSPRLWIFEDQLEIAPSHKNPLKDELCKILSRHFPGVRSRSSLKFNLLELCLEKFTAFVADVKAICNQENC